ncbi:DUF4342 domain-containing protein [Sphingobacterium bovistauri]|uniref:DUF4342 domain-containing protein n=1 Tax=Sphingobacterium bovistauri TaxID=2781959 RepID=A0ABS7Z8E2_9SPHI|nr:DUF4342 domain-containing protein [Sphingobacterium bovistauri]MCA5006473.1 DUF4342 domain-containing protein [Sphingobacterium bovistauri]
MLSRVKSFISNFTNKLGKLRFIANAESGKKILDLPLIAVIIIGLLLPFLTVILVAIALMMSIKINIESRENEIILLDKQ